MGWRLYSAAAQALVDSQALAWDTVTMDRLMLEHPAIALNVFHLMAEWVQQASTCLGDLATGPVEHRIARALMQIEYPERGEAEEWKGLEMALALS